MTDQNHVNPESVCEIVTTGDCELERECRKFSDWLKRNDVRYCGIPYEPCEEFDEEDQETLRDDVETWNHVMNTSFHVIGRYATELFFRNVEGFWCMVMDDNLFRFLAFDESEFLDGLRENSGRTKYIKDPFDRQLGHFDDKLIQSLM